MRLIKTFGVRPMQVGGLLQSRRDWYSRLAPRSNLASVLYYYKSVGQAEYA